MLEKKELNLVGEWCVLIGFQSWMKVEKIVTKRSKDDTNWGLDTAPVGKIHKITTKAEFFPLDKLVHVHSDISQSRSYLLENHLSLCATTY